MVSQPSDVGIYDLVIRATLMDGVKIVSEEKVIGRKPTPVRRPNRIVLSEDTVYAVMSTRTGGSSLGAATAYLKNTDGSVVLFASGRDAENRETRYTDKLSSVHVHYHAVEYHD